MKTPTVLLLIASASFSSEGILAAQTSTGYRKPLPEMEELAAYYAQRRKEGGTSTTSSASVPGWIYGNTSYPCAFISVAPSVMFVSSKEQFNVPNDQIIPEGSYDLGRGNITMIGGMGEAGLFFTENLRLSLNAGYYYGDKTQSGGTSVMGIPVGVTLKREYDFIPVWLTFDYTFNLPYDFQFRIGPTIGVTVAEMKLSETVMVGSKRGTASVSDTDWMFTCGVNAGLTWQFNEHLFVGIDYRFLASTSPSFEKYGYSVDYGTVLSHQVALSLGWRF